MFLHSCTSYRMIELFMNTITCQNCNRPKVGMFCLLTAYGQKVKSGNISSIVSLSWSFLLLNTIGQVFSCSPFVNQTSCAYPWIHHKRGKDLPSNGHGTEVCELDKPSNLDLQLPHTWRVSGSLSWTNSQHLSMSLSFSSTLSYMAKMIMISESEPRPLSFILGG